MPVINWRDWANLGLSVLFCRNHVACPDLPLLLAPSAPEGKAWSMGVSPQANTCKVFGDLNHLTVLSPLLGCSVPSSAFGSPA